MNEGEIEILVKNEIEWRKVMFKSVHDIKEEQIKQGIAIGKLDIKSGLWGVIGGLIATAGMLLLAFARGIFKT